MSTNPYTDEELSALFEAEAEACMEWEQDEGQTDQG